MKHTSLTLALSAVVAGALALGACGGDDEDPKYACTYEERSTGCNNSTYGPWEERCLDIEYPREDLTAEGWCDAVISDTFECAGSCCVTFQFRNAQPHLGLCTDL